MRRIRLTESSLILTWLTPEHGRIKTVAKGALRPKSRLAGVLDLFHLCEIQFQPSRAGDLHSLRDALLLDSFPGLRTNYAKISLSAYAIELIERCTETNFPMPDIFNLLERALRFLDRNTASQRALLHFEAELVRLLGITQPDASATISLERLLQRLPSSRAELMGRLTPDSTQSQSTEPPPSDLNPRS